MGARMPVTFSSPPPPPPPTQGLSLGPATFHRIVAKNQAYNVAWEGASRSQIYSHPAMSTGLSPQCWSVTQAMATSRPVP